MCLYADCPLMVNQNLEVKNGVANGTTCTFEKVVLKTGKTPTPIKMWGHWVQAVDIEDLEYIECRWKEDSRYQGTFRLHAKEETFIVRYPIEEWGKNTRIPVSMKITSFPVVSNKATTGHKLQGKSVDTLVIAEWNGQRNWAYVVTSRVKTLKGLYLLDPPPEDIDFGPSPKCLQMMERLRESILITP